MKMTVLTTSVLKNLKIKLIWYRLLATQHPITYEILAWFKKLFAFGILCLWALLLSINLACAQSVNLDTGVVRLNIPVKSWQKKVFNEVLPQQTDFSCGAAALASLLRYAYSVDIDENTVINAMLENADINIVREQGFSMLDMKRFAEKIGFQVRGYKITVEKLNELKVPVLALVDVRGYQHFVVIKRAVDGFVMVADPALGNHAVPADEFEKRWNGIILAIVGQGLRQESQMVNVLGPASLKLRGEALLALKTFPKDYGLNGLNSF